MKESLIENTQTSESENLSTLSFKGDHAAISVIGIIHGLASNDELLLLVVIGLGLTTYWKLFLALTVFTLGVSVGMILFGLIIKLSFKQLIRQEKVLKIINLTIATISIAYGVFTLVGGEGVNLLPFIAEELTVAYFLIAFILGLKHSMDVDHVVAISSVLVRAPTVKKTITLSLSWALGHMVTAGIITFILYAAREAFLQTFLSHFESLVSIMLIIIGLLTIAWEFDWIKFGKHSHGHIHKNGPIHHHTKGEIKHTHEHSKTE